MSNDSVLPIVREENIKEIVHSAPQAYEANQLSRQRCEAAGKVLLDSIKQTGMTDELDQKAATYIEKARRTVKAMNDRRSPVTKLFDQVRTAYTQMESSINPATQGTIAYMLQQERNAYAAKKHAEEEKRQREHLAAQQLQQQRTQLAIDIEDDIKQQFKAVIDKVVAFIQAFGSDLTLENYNETEKVLKECRTELPDSWMRDLKVSVHVPYALSKEAVAMIDEAKVRLLPKLREQYRYEATSNRDYVLDRLPSRKTELERIAKASADEAKKLQAEKERREAEEKERLEEERKKKELDELRKQQAQKQAAQLQGLFDNQAQMQSYQPKVKVQKKIHLLNVDGILPVISLWWANEGHNLSVEEIMKMFKKQLTYCEKLANSPTPTMIDNESLEYVDEVKAK